MVSQGVIVVISFSLFASLAGLTSCANRRAISSSPARAPWSQYEREFLLNRIAHQQAAIEMARACEQKAVRNELKEFCRMLSRTESEEATQLQDWSNQWYGVPKKPQTLENATQGYRNFLASVQTSSGPKFEEAFLRALRLHHHEGVSESKECQDRADHAELRNFCARMVREQEMEIGQANSWVCDWFRDCVER